MSKVGYVIKNLKGTYGVVIKTVNYITTPHCVIRWTDIGDSVHSLEFIYAFTVYANINNLSPLQLSLLGIKRG